MSNNKQYLRGSKRLQIINKWLRGIDDEEYDVFPCKIEGKYIVKPREKPLNKSTEPNKNNQSNKQSKDNSKTKTKTNKL